MYYRIAQKTDQGNKHLNPCPDVNVTLSFFSVWIEGKWRLALIDSDYSWMLVRVKQCGL